MASSVCIERTQVLMRLLGQVFKIEGVLSEFSPELEYIWMRWGFEGTNYYHKYAEPVGRYSVGDWVTIDQINGTWRKATLAEVIFWNRSCASVK